MLNSRKGGRDGLICLSRNESHDPVAMVLPGLSGCELDDSRRSSTELQGFLYSRIELESGGGEMSG